MTILDRYIARHFLLNVLVLLVLFSSLFIAIDVVLNMNKFVSAGAKLAGSQGTLRHVVATIVWIIDYWGPRLLLTLNLLLGMVLVTAMGFTCVQLVRRRELVAAVASGVSLHRLTRPFLLIALLVGGVQVLNQEVLVPAVAPLLTRSPEDALHRDLRETSVPLLKDGQSRLFFAAKFNKRERSLQNARIWERDNQGRVVRTIDAEHAVWDRDAWILERPRISDIPNPPERLRLPTDLDPTAIGARLFAYYGRNLSWAQIDRMLSSSGPVDTATRDRFDRIRFGRFSTVLCNILALIIALPFYLVREPRNMAVQTLKCAPLVSAALLAAVLGPATPVPGLPVWLAVFTPALILAPAALAASVSIRT
ncbi:MAG: LptF/LptG family permease [Phycisphaerales bacterium]